MNDFTPNTTISADDTLPYIPREPWMTDADFQWVLLEARARINTEERKQASPPKALIAIKAQHPLTADGKPGPEYLGRLRQALAVAKELRGSGYAAVEFMTFGGVHDGSGVALADAGAQWLIDCADIQPEKVHRHCTVFSGNDEDRLAAEFMNEHPEFTELHVVLSVGQIPRAQLYYIWIGWQPTLHPITLTFAAPNHSFVKELWGPWAVPSFARGPEAVAAATEEICKKHLDAAKTTPASQPQQ